MTTAALLIIVGTTFALAVALAAFARGFALEKIGVFGLEAKLAEPIKVSGITVLWLPAALLLGTSFLFAGIWLVRALPAAQPTSPHLDRLESRAEGVPVSQCSAEPGASVIQLFEQGWLLIRFSSHTIYSITRLPDGLLKWTKHFDASDSATQADCAGIAGEDLLEWGFRKTYCADSSLRESLGQPQTREELAWVQFQEWSGGLLIYGIPGTIPGIREGKFRQLFGLFLDDASLRDAYSGRWVKVTPNNSQMNVYCTSLWYKAARRAGGQATSDALPELRRRRDCEEIVHPSRYIEGAKRCSVFGF